MDLSSKLMDDQQHTKMNNFIVLVEGKNCVICFSGKRRSLRNLFGTRRGLEKTGFFATRCAFAETAADAERMIVESIRRELETQWGIQNPDSDPPIFVVSETRYADSVDDPGITAKGFSFYSCDECH